MKFPIIRNIDDLLQSINQKHFIIKKTPLYISVCYYFNSEEVFPSRLTNPVEYSYSVECRGIKFCPVTGKILARPLHKFFNLNERNDSSKEEITKIYNKSYNITIMEKLDGSMIHPMKIHTGEILWCTKMGTNSISNMAENFVKKNRNYIDFAEWCFSQGEMGWTPIFEYVSLENRIVIEYEKENLILIAIRDNVTGKYVKYEEN
ncbi:MAG: T4 RnlA family RNA ligase [Candidatus Woesearchaeota archaeon]